jgi:hypothetical protein
LAVTFQLIFDWVCVIKNKKMEATVAEIKKKEICKCENCGNEAEMVVTCTLPEFENSEASDPGTSKPTVKKAENKVKGTATCTQCGNEADMWIDL